MKYFGIVILSAVFALVGCVKAATTTIGAAASVSKTAVKTGAKTTVAAVDLVTPDGDKGDNADHHAGGGHHDDNPRPFDKTRDANQDLDIALAAAKSSGKNALLVFGGNWCHDSRGLAAKFQEPSLAALIEEYYILTWIDVGHRDRNLDVLRRVGVNDIFGTPTIVILSPNGDIVNEDTVHDWRTADSKSFEETFEYFEMFAGANSHPEKYNSNNSHKEENAGEL